MFETTSEMSVNEHKSQNGNLNNQIVSLPTIPRKLQSRGQVKSRKQDPQKQKLILPTISQTQNDFSIPNQTEKDKQNFQLKNKIAFAKEVREKLNLVLGEMRHLDNVQGQNDNDSDDLDFQAKINQNKEIIKMHKLRRQNEKNNPPTQRNKQPANDNKIKRQIKPRNQSLYERRVKQYRDQSSQNKYLQKRKQTVREQINPSPHDQAVANEYYRDARKEQQSARKQIKRSKDKSEAPKGLSQKSSYKNINQLNKNISLYDSIQNYLENPHENNKKDGNKLVGLTLLKAKRDIEDKIKAINQKLGITQNQEIIKKQRLFEIDPETSAKQWRRISINNQKVDYLQSNFDKELERVGSLQERNSLNLQKYLEHQKILLELQARKSQGFRKQPHTNSL